MDAAAIIALGIGLVLGGIMVWLYRNATDRGRIATADYDALKTKLQAVETSLAISADREAGLQQQKDQLLISVDTWRNKSELAVRELDVTRSVKDDALSRLAATTKEAATAADQLKQAERDANTKGNLVVQLQQEVKNKDERYNNQKKDFEEIKSKLEAEFRVIANSILDTSSQKLTQQQSEKLNDLLLPFRQQIDGFKKDIDTKFTHEATEKGSLKQQIESLVGLNQTIAKEALALTEALRGSTKKQGDWGEDILERILEYSGLQKDVQYFVQPQSQNEEGKIIRPDIIVRYPDTRYLVIDAKVSLTHYWDFCNAATPEEQKIYIPKIVSSLKAHMDGLAVKKYTDIASTPDFIIMFMPVEAAYITAMQHDHTLWQYAYDRKILLISPTNLLPAMKMVSIMWDKDAVNRDGELIVKKAVNLYEKFHGFIATFESVGADIDKAQKRWSEAKGQLHTGRDNFISQGGKLKQLLGKRTNKELPQQIVDAAMLEDEVRSDADEDSTV